MADYWMKLYMEILDDPKMATLPDRLWRRVIELFLLAKRTGKDGELPNTSQIAWALRLDTDELLLDLRQITTVGIIEPLPDGWMVVNFQKRQTPSTAAERKRQQREREYKEQYYVTEMSRNVRQNQNQNQIQNQIIEKIEGADDISSSALPEIATLYEKTFGCLITSMQAEKLKAWADDYGFPRVKDALEKTALNNGRSLAYTERILMNKNQSPQGKKPEKEKKRYDEGKYAEFITH